MLPDIVNNSLSDIGFVAGRDSFVLGVSGGVDSMVLMYLLHKLNFGLIPVHVNYHKRGKESDKDQLLVEEKTREYGLKLYVHPVLPEDAEGNFQEWARKERYQVFREIKRENQAAGIIVAHHLDDQIETILQKMLRGSGMDSWQGMSDFDGEIVRPLLTVSRAEIMRYADENGIQFRHDQSNFESGYARNFIRNQWMPRMDKLFPGWRSNILKIPEKAALFDESVAILVSQIQESPGIIRREEYLKYSKSMREAMTQHVVKSIFGHDSALSLKALENLDTLETLQTGGRLQLQKDIFIIRNRHQFIFERDYHNEKNGLPVQLAYEQVLNEPFKIDGFQLQMQKCERPFSDKYLQLKLRESDFPITIRYWREGDRFQPLGMQGHQKISDHLTNKKVDASKKNEAFVILSFEEKICAVIFPHSENKSLGSISENVKCNETTGEALVIEKM